MNNLKLLMELKPALDGYAGIPQETRLLFSGFQGFNNDLQVDGLLQHGNEVLWSPAKDDSNDCSQNEKLFGASRTVTSFDPDSFQGRLSGYKRLFSHLNRLRRLRWQAYRDRPMPLTEFPAVDFPDFIWSRLFEKTLNEYEKDKVIQAKYMLLEQPRSMFELTSLNGITRFHPAAFLRLATLGYDFVLSQTPFPALVSPGTKLIVRYHDAIPIFMPHTINHKQTHLAVHYLTLKRNVECGAYFACNSEATRNDLLRVFPELEHRAQVIHNIVLNDYQPDSTPKQYAQNIIQSRQSMEFSEGNSSRPPEDYLLMVSTLEPRKNHSRLISAWERLRAEGHDGLALVLVGAKGWNFRPIVESMRPWIMRGALYHLADVKPWELRALYRHAAICVCPSLAEGFDYTGIEAMRCHGLVVASDIPVHKEVFGSGAVYFNPYSVSDLTSTIARLLSIAGKDECAALRMAASGIVDRYTPEVILTQWNDFLTSALSP